MSKLLHHMSMAGLAIDQARLELDLAKRYWHEMPQGEESERDLQDLQNTLDMLAAEVDVWPEWLDGLRDAINGG